MKQGETYEKCRRCGKEMKEYGKSPALGWCKDCYEDLVRNNSPFRTIIKEDGEITPLPIEGIEIRITSSKTDGKKTKTEVEEIKLNDRASKIIERLLGDEVKQDTTRIIRTILKEVEKEIKG